MHNIFFTLQKTVVTFFLRFFLLAANYLDNWKCIAVLRGDGMASPIAGLSQSSKTKSGRLGQEPASQSTALGALKTQKFWYSAD